MPFTLCSSAAITTKAGLGVNSTAASSEALLQRLSEQAEARIAAVSREDWVSLYSGLTAGTKEILDDACSNLAAIYLVAYDMSGYTSRVEAEDIINVLRDSALFNLGLLKDQKRVKFIK